MTSYRLMKETSLTPPRTCDPTMGARVLIVDNAVHRWLFKPAWHWMAHLQGVETVTLNIPFERGVQRLDGFTHVILTGSEASILRPKRWFDAEVGLIREAADRDIPILGSCFGHQMLVYALSGSQFLRPSNPPEIGWAQIEMTHADPLFDGLPNPWSTFVYHFDEVFEPPTPWLKLGRTSQCDTHVLRYGDRSVWGIQAHPEISARRAKFFVQAAVVMGKEPVRNGLRALRTAPPDNSIVDRFLDRFLAVRTARC